MSASKSSLLSTISSSTAARINANVVQFDFIVSPSAIGLLVSLMSGPRDSQADHRESDQRLLTWSSLAAICSPACARTETLVLLPCLLPFQLHIHHVRSRSAAPVRIITVVI